MIPFTAAKHNNSASIFKTFLFQSFTLNSCNCWLQKKKKDPSRFTRKSQPDKHTDTPSRRASQIEMNAKNPCLRDLMPPIVKINNNKASTQSQYQKKKTLRDRFYDLP